MENPFDHALHNAPAPVFQKAGAEASKQQRWEHRVVHTLLLHYGLTGHSPSLSNAARKRDGIRRLTFLDFRVLCPSFPCWLVSLKIPYVHRISMGDFVRGFEKTSLYKAFESGEADAPEEYQSGRCGLVFEWLHVWPMAIIHNDYRGIRTKETVIFRNLPDVNPQQLLAVQSFTSFLDALPWSP